LLGIDIRIQTTLFRNSKIFRLKRRHGAEAVLSLIQLWCYTREHHPDGDLTTMTPDEIEMLAAGWTGEAGVLYGALESLGLIDETDGKIVVHDWDEHQPWSVESPRRVQAATKAARARWGDKRNPAPEQENDAVRMRPACDAHMRSDAMGNAPDLTGPDLTGPDRTGITPPPPLPGGDTEMGSAPPVEGDTGSDWDEVCGKCFHARADVEGDPCPRTSTGKHEWVEDMGERARTTVHEQEPEPMPDAPKPAKERDKALDRHAQGLVEHYQAKVKTAHRCSKGQAIRNARTTIVAMRKDAAHADCPDDETRAGRLRDVVDRYASATATTDPTYRKHAANFFGRDAVWQAYLTPDAARPVAPAGKPQAARKDPLREQAERCYKGYPGCNGKPGSQELACQVCRARAPRDPAKSMPDYTGMAERQRRERDEDAEGERA
jgi:hypothetical protein